MASTDLSSSDIEEDSVISSTPGSPKLASNTVNHPAAFTFPALSFDGSLQSSLHLAQHPSRSSPHPFITPPAALSSLGAKARMAQPSNVVDSVASLADSQYDMLDDFSDTSNDDRETASLASTEHASDMGGMITSSEDEAEPFVDGSLVDIGECQEQTFMRSASQKRTEQENELIDSYLSDQLETPRQSIFLNKSKSQRMLFFSERDVTAADMSRVCGRIAEGLSGCDSETPSKPRVVNLPPTPAGINPSFTLMLATNDFELIAQRCVDTEVHSGRPDAYKLSFVDADNQHSKIMTIAKDGKENLERPDLAVFYLKQTQAYPEWFNNAKQAMDMLKVPTLTIGGPEFNFAWLPTHVAKKAYDSDFVLSNTHFMEGSNAELRANLDELLEFKKASIASASSKHERLRSRGGVKKNSFVRWLLSISAILVPMMTYLFLNTQSLMNPAAELAMRRNALSAALIELTNSTEIAQRFNIEHLVPQITNDTTGVAPFQGASPNYIVISFMKQPAGRSFPYETATSVYRHTGVSVNFNLTKLIDGIYAVTVPMEEAHGEIWTSVWTQNPRNQVLVSHNFGSSRGRSLSKAATKELSVVRDVTMYWWTRKLSTPVSTGILATKNMTTELAVAMTRDLQVFSSTTFSKFARKTNSTATSIKDFVMIHREVVKMTKDLQQYVSSTALALVPSRDSLAGRLAISRRRARFLADRLLGPKDANSSSVTKELSLRIQNIFNPSSNSGPPTRAADLANMARCVRAEDYKSCRRAQRLQQALAPVPPSALSTLSQVPLFGAKAAQSSPLRRGKKAPESAAPKTNDKAKGKDVRSAKDKKVKVSKHKNARTSFTHKSAHGTEEQKKSKRVRTGVDNKNTAGGKKK